MGSVMVGGLLFAGGCGSAKSDADTLCKIAGEANASTVPSAARMSQFVTKFEAANLSDESEKLFIKIATVEPSSRYRFIQASFVERGVAGWSCPALEELFAPRPQPGSP